jgi:superfamily II DNA helicase RecQ
MKKWAEILLAYHTPIPNDYTKKYEERIASQAETSVKQAPTQPIIVEKPKTPDPVVETAAPSLPQSDELVSKLKDFRLKQSRVENIKAYCVFTDKQMQDLLSKMPKTADELLGVTGFGPVKVEKYGAAIIDLLNEGMTKPTFVL